MRSRAIRIICYAAIGTLAASSGCAKNPAQNWLVQRLVAKNQATREEALKEASGLAPEARRALAGSLAALLRGGDASTRGNAVDAVTKLNLPGRELRAALVVALNGMGTEDALATAFLYRIAGRWNSAYFRKGNESWWPDHGTARPKNQTHYLFTPKELLIESRPEFSPPSITDRFVYGSVRKISADLFDVELHKPGEATGGEIRRFKLSPDGKTLEIAVDAERTAEPTVQVLELVDADWSNEANGP